jgi:antitoxin component YwqK of YwqJK toxin-antitoxin module
VLGNHPQTIKNIIDSYKADENITQQQVYTTIKSQLARQSVCDVFIHIPVLFENFKYHFGYSAWTNLNRYKNEIISFSGIAIQVDEDDQLLHTKCILHFDEHSNAYQREFYNIDNIVRIPVTKPVEQDTVMRVTRAEIIIPDLDVNKFEDYYENGTLKLSVRVKNGLKHGNYREYYKSGQLKVKGKFKHGAKDDTWEYFLPDGALQRSEQYNKGKQLANE